MQIKLGKGTKSQCLVRMNSCKAYDAHHELKDTEALNEFVLSTSERTESDRKKGSLL